MGCSGSWRAGLYCIYLLPRLGWQNNPNQNRWEVFSDQDGHPCSKSVSYSAANQAQSSIIESLPVWRLDKDVTGEHIAGVLLDLGLHLVTIPRWIAENEVSRMRFH